MIKYDAGMLGAKNNDSLSEKLAIVKFYTMEYRKCGNSNSKNDSRPCMGASAILKSVDFRAFAVNVKTIAPIQKLYQSGHAIWWHATPAPVNTFLESYDWKGKLIIPFCTSGESDIVETMPTFLNSCEGLAVHEGRRIQGAGEVDAWLEELDLGLSGNEK